jgi:hypothetical protein
VLVVVSIYNLPDAIHESGALTEFVITAGVGDTVTVIVIGTVNVVATIWVWVTTGGVIVIVVAGCVMVTVVGGITVTTSVVVTKVRMAKLITDRTTTNRVFLIVISSINPFSIYKFIG